jgi:hypothetical protein
LPRWITAIADWGTKLLGRSACRPLPDARDRAQSERAAPAQGAQTSIYLATADAPGKPSCKASFWADCHQFALPPTCYDEAKKECVRSGAARADLTVLAARSGAGSAGTRASGRTA